MTRYRSLSVAGGCWLAVVSVLGACGGQASVERWGVWEASFPGPAGSCPYVEAHLSATLSHGNRDIEVPGFWDGGDVFRIRFSPPSDGEWRFVTRSNRPELDGKTGAFTVAPPGAGNHGPVEVFRTFHLRHADGTAHHSFGTTCYAWTHQPDALQEQTLATLSASPFNKIRFCVFPKSYAYNTNEPARFPFVRREDRTFDFDRPDPAFWRHFEQRILDLQRLGIEADLILWHPYDRWGFSEMTKEQDDRYLRYCIARLSAFRNVWWSLANEYDLMAPAAMKGHRGNKTMADWDRFFRILDREDPHGRLRSIHNCRGFYDHTRPWVTHASLQTSDMQRGVEFRRTFGKPVIYDECKYEGDVPQGWGSLTAREMAERFWLGTLSGCYVGHGETYRHPDDILWWSKGGTLHGQSPERIRWLREFMAQAPPFHEMVPLGDAKGRYLLAQPGAWYLLYAAESRPQPLELTGDRPYKIDRVDPWRMTVAPMGTARPGAQAFDPPQAGMAYRFTPYAPDEPLRPEASIAATPSAGRAPLEVRFAAPAGLRTRWDFGDGAVSEAPSPSHRFTRPGLYSVTLTVTDPHGGSASAVREILVDRDPAAPLLRLGVSDGESHAMKLGGSARRSDAGGFLFTAAEPWGWAETGVVADLRGLRAFTVTGWLRPDRLTTGAGGNRILFCLNHNRDGIDLVCHADGRLRLAVNQWPDAVSNDSAPGRLVPGRWTRFAVAYDGTRDRDNVRWSFSAPLDAPDPAAPLAHDRTTSHDAGPVGGDIGPLAVGNFNATLRGAGLDRQFRGEIRGLTLFGSRADHSGASPGLLPSRGPDVPAGSAGGSGFDDAVTNVIVTLDAVPGTEAVRRWAPPFAGSVRLVGRLQKRSPGADAVVDVRVDGTAVWTRKLDAADSLRHGFDIAACDLRANSAVDLRVTAPAAPVRVDADFQVVPEPFLSRWAPDLPSGYPTWTEDEKAILRRKGQDILQAIREASKSRRGKIVVPPGDYLFHARWSQASTLEDLADLEIVADGATFWFEPPMIHALLFENCRNVAVRGLTIDFTLPCWFQARVTEVDRAAKTLRAEIMKGYEPRNAEGQAEIQGDRAFMFYDSNGRFINHPHSPGAWQLSGDGRSVLCRDIERSGIPAALKAGDYVVGTIRTGAALRSRNGAGMRFEDAHVWSSPGVAVYEGGGAGSNVYRRVRATRRPRTNRLQAFGVDIFHIAGADRGPTLDRCEMAYGADDNLNIHGSFGRVVQRRDDRRYYLQGPCVAGDTLEFRHPGSIAPLGIARVASVTNTPGGPSLAINDRYEAKGEVLVELDRPLDLPPLALVVPDGKRSAAGFVLRHCWLHDNFQRTLINGSPGGLIENNTLQNVGQGLAIQFEIWGPWMEGPFARDLVVRGNRFIDAPPDGTQFGVSMHPPGGGSNRRRFEARPVTNLTIAGNYFGRTSGLPLDIHNVDGLKIHDNQVDRPADAPRPSRHGLASDASWYYLQDCANVSVRGNETPGGSGPTEGGAGP